MCDILNRQNIQLLHNDSPGNRPTEQRRSRSASRKRVGDETSASLLRQNFLVTLDAFSLRIFPPEWFNLSYMNILGRRTNALINRRHAPSLSFSLSSLIPINPAYSLAGLGWDGLQCRRDPGRFFPIIPFSISHRVQRLFAAFLVCVYARMHTVAPARLHNKKRSHVTSVPSSPIWRAHVYVGRRAGSWKICFYFPETLLHIKAWFTSHAFLRPRVYNLIFHTHLLHQARV